MKKVKKTNAVSRKRPQGGAAKPYWKMTTDELRRATAEFDGELATDSFGEPAPEQRAQDHRARRKRGRPRVGLGAQTISVTIEKGLLAQADRLARKLRVHRAKLIARGLQATR